VPAYTVLHDKSLMEIAKVRPMDPIEWEPLKPALVELALTASDWPADLDGPFDAISAGYVLHEFDDETKHQVLDLARRRLAPGGRIAVGDVAFESRAALETAREELRHLWDDDEFYWAADEAI